ncbi:probable magnesium transporter NIPA9 [Musa acuminata AAA Group]|uniref:probable magnesium transporter NIPA9 n=1 Tax=Musa acuminata AAA Group TaxID=214697 RepID=UPI0031D8321D
MWESICLMLMATAGNNIGKVLQKKGTVILPRLSFKLKVIRAYVLNKLWIIGFLMDICGAVLMLRALSQAPVSVIQPVSGCGLAILCVFSHFYLKEVMNALDWVGIALAGAGTIGNSPLFASCASCIVMFGAFSRRPGVGIGGDKQNGSTVSLFHLPLLGISVALLFALLNTWLRIYKSRRQEQELMHSEVIEEIIYGLESGILFGMASVISKMGFMFSEEGFSKIMVPICISISICCSASGFVYQTQGLKHGRAIVVSTCAAVASIITGVLAGMFALGEHMPSSPVARVALSLGWIFITLGVILLVSSARLMALLPRPLRRHLRRSNLENHTLRRSGSLRIKDPSPSAVIHASTLHHLITSPSKEKA